jgi:hypothetical protein
MSILRFPVVHLRKWFTQFMVVSFHKFYVMSSMVALRPSHHQVILTPHKLLTNQSDTIVSAELNMRCSCRKLMVVFFSTCKLLDTILGPNTRSMYMYFIQLCIRRQFETYWGPCLSFL